ncbi:hypothetical protein B0H14DRAFT_2802199 [Mycena olivaceomarginata]|nr:hypothetical protein B0H14DRAFT_2802199 [Mycena olivaceomarginata]
MFDPSDLQQRTVGTDPPNLIRAFTHTMSRTSGISVCFGTTQDEMVLSNAKLELREMNSTAAPSGAGVSQGSRGGEPAQHPHYRIRSLRALSRRYRFLCRFVSIHDLRVTLLYFRELLWAAAVDVGSQPRSPSGAVDPRVVGKRDGGNAPR